jgi:rare lipoprotein A
MRILAILLLLMSANGHVMTGASSHYGWVWSGQRIGASGIQVNGNDPVAAHRSLPFGTIVTVTNVTTGKSTNVIIFDRGPYARGRVIDLQPSSMYQIAPGKHGRPMGGCRVSLKVIDSSYSCEGYKCLSKKLGKKRITDDMLDAMLNKKEKWGE